MTAGKKQLYVISSDNTLLTEELKSTLLAKARKQGFTQRERLIIENQQNWQELPMLLQNQGLFCDKILLDASYSQAKFDKKIQSYLQTLLELTTSNTFVILTIGKLTAAQRKAKWFLELQKQANVQILWPPKPAEYSQWLHQRAKLNHININQSAVNLLAQLTQGNLLAAKQALEKLSLLYPQEAIDEKKLMHVMHDSAKFTVFDLTSYALQGHYKQALHTLNNLKSSGVEPILVLWALAKESRELLNPQQSKQWAACKSQLQSAKRRHTTKTLATLIHLSHQADCAIKGIIPKDPWLLLSDITQLLALGTTK